jgi:hypothetical protein
MVCKYQEWINENYPNQVSARLQCEKATLRMLEAFPELKRVRGQIELMDATGLYPSKEPHWWLINESGEVVDPTAHQYMKKISQYLPCDESKGEPSGTCPNCGGICYEGNYICSEKCTKEYVAYLDGENNV